MNTSMEIDANFFLKSEEYQAKRQDLLNKVRPSKVSKDLTEEQSFLTNTSIAAVNKFFRLLLPKLLRPIWLSAANKEHTPRMLAGVNSDGLNSKLTCLIFRKCSLICLLLVLWQTCPKHQETASVKKRFQGRVQLWYLVHQIPGSCLAESPFLFLK